MKGKIIYVDFIKKRRINFIHFIANKIISLFFIKFNAKANSFQNMDLNKRKRISN
jgi:hypothetical protein